MRNKTTESTEDTERGFLESQNMSAKNLILFRLIIRGYLVLYFISYFFIFSRENLCNLVVG